MLDKVTDLLKEKQTLFEGIKSVNDSIRRNSIKKKRAAKKNKAIDKFDLSKKRKLPVDFLNNKRSLKKKSN